MKKYLHKVAGIYSSITVAETTRNHLIKHGLSPEQIVILRPGEPSPDDKIEPEGNAVLKEVIKDGVIGTAVGSGIGALGVVGMMAANVSLFLASPLIGPLAIIGWGAGIGAMAGASAGAGVREGRFADIIKTALDSGHCVVIAHAVTEAETAIAQDLLSASVSGTGDVQSL